MKTEKWLNFDFSNNGLSANHENRSEAFEQFSRDVRSDVNYMLKNTGWELAKFSKGYFYCSGFLYNKEFDKYVYFSMSDVRFFQNEWNDNLLIRTAKHLKDFAGGKNLYCKFNELSKKLEDVEHWDYFGYVPSIKEYNHE